MGKIRSRLTAECASAVDGGYAAGGSGAPRSRRDARVVVPPFGPGCAGDSKHLQKPHVRLLARRGLEPQVARAGLAATRIGLRPLPSPGPRDSGGSALAKYPAHAPRPIGQRRENQASWDKLRAGCLSPSSDGAAERTRQPYPSINLSARRPDPSGAESSSLGDTRNRYTGFRRLVFYRLGSAVVSDVWSLADSASDFSFCASGAKTLMGRITAYRMVFPSSLNLLFRRAKLLG